MKMAMEKKNGQQLTNGELKEVKGGIPYEMPILINLAEAMGSCRTGTHCDNGSADSCSSGRYCGTGSHKSTTISE